MLKLFVGAIAALLIFTTTATVQAESQPAPQFRKPAAPEILPAPKFRPHTAPAVSKPVPQRFWVINNTPYTVQNVFVQKDRSKGTRDLMGPNGTIDPFDQALVLKPQSNRCTSNVGIVVFDPSDETTSTNWYSDVDICDADTEVVVSAWDFDEWKD